MQAAERADVFAFGHYGHAKSGGGKCSGRIRMWRVKSVRILGLQPTDTLEYRVITNVLPTHPLAPDFWLAHSFDRSGVVAKESFTIDLPAAQHVQMQINPATIRECKRNGFGEAFRTRNLLSWQRDAKNQRQLLSRLPMGDAPDIAFSTF